MEDSRNTIERLYMNILGRRPDDSGLETYTKILEGPDRGEAIAEILHALITSNEYKVLNSSARKEDDADNRRKIKINGFPVSHIVSLGTHCLTSYLLKKNDLKKYSLPSNKEL